MRAKGPGQSALLLLDVIRVLDRRRVPYAVIGALAASFYGVVRASLDADAVISLPPGRAREKALAEELSRAGCKVSCRRGDEGDPIGVVLAVEDDFKNRVDLLVGIRGVAEEVFSRAVETQFMRSPIRLIGVEDFIAMKIFAGSPKDLADVSGVLGVSRGRIRMPLLRELVGRRGPKALSTLESLLRAKPHER